MMIAVSFSLFVLVGNGTGKILKGAGQGVGHAFGGCKFIIENLLLLSSLDAYTYFFSGWWCVADWKRHWKRHHKRRWASCRRWLSTRIRVSWIRLGNWSRNSCGRCRRWDLFSWPWSLLWCEESRQRRRRSLLWQKAGTKVPVSVPIESIVIATISLAVEPLFCIS